MRRLMLSLGKLGKGVVLQFLLTLVNTLLSKRFSLASKQQVYDFRNSGFFYRNQEIDVAQIYQDWEFGDQLWRIGDYQKSVDLRRKLLEDLYLSEGIVDTSYAPPVMSVSWTSAFGHLGFLGVFSAAQKLGIVSSEKRVLLLNSTVASRNAEQIFGASFNKVPSKYGHTALENPNQWHISERLQMIRSKTGFICLYELHDRVFAHPEYKNALPAVNPEYIEWARLRLEEVGLPRDAWFVSLHIRDNFGKNDVRSVDANTFSPAIDEVIRSGGFVIQFGINSSQRVTSRKGLINLESIFSDHSDFHLFLLAQARFLLTTNSGPSVIAWSLGTPVLQTNTTSIARNILRTPTKSIFLPKHYFDKHKRELGFREIAGGRLGYSEINLNDLYKLGFNVSDNTPDEILEATQELMSSINSEKASNTLVKKLNEIRRDTSAVGHGDVATSFLTKNSRWLED
jgi:putative glycosyltransferase (TIGR04372 family)